MIAERGVWARRRYRGFEQPARQVPQELVLPRKPPRETDFAAERPKGDGFRLVSVSLARFRDIPPGKLPRGAPRATVFARFPSPPRAFTASRQDSCRETARGRRILPRGIPRVTDFARFPSPSHALAAPRWGSCRETPRGRRILPRNTPRRTVFARFPFPSRVSVAPAAQPAPHHTPPSTQKARLERRAFTTKLCSRTRAYRLSASTGQEEMQAPHSMHSSSLTSA